MAHLSTLGKNTSWIGEVCNTLNTTSLTSLVDNHWPTAGLRVNLSLLKAGIGSNPLFLLEGITILPSNPPTSVWSRWKVDLLELKCPALNTLTFCQQGLTLKNVRMTLSRTLKRMCDQRLKAAYRPNWSPGLCELNLKSLQLPSLETAVLPLAVTWR